MVRNLIAALDRFVRGAVYIAVLSIGLSLAVLGAYLALGLCFRAGQFLHRVLLSHPW